MDKGGSLNRLMHIYDTLYNSFGPQRWWPADTQFEVVVGAVLTQQAPWKNVETAIGNLRKHGLLDPERLANADLKLVRKLIQPAGFYNVKSRRLKKIAALYPRMRELSRKSLDEARQGILEIDGIGPETADSILLYAFGMPTFVVDAYTKRFVKRYGFAKGWKKVDYETTKRFFEENIERNAVVYNEFHALIVELGKRHCRTKPLCGGCPLGKSCRRLV